MKPNRISECIKPAAKRGKKGKSRRQTAGTETAEARERAPGGADDAVHFAERVGALPPGYTNDGSGDDGPPFDLPPAAYEHRRQTYWRPDARGIWIEVSEHALKAYFLPRLPEPRPRDEAEQAEVERMGKTGRKAWRRERIAAELGNAITRVQHERAVEYAGPLAGWRARVYEENGIRILVTDSPKLIQPQPGGCPMIDAILDRMLGPEQRAHFEAWLKVGIEAVRDNRRRNGQVVCFVGPPDSGKSFLQGHVITPLLGGREEEPDLVLQKETSFNRHLFRAEHLASSDPGSTPDARSRRSLAENLKKLAANETHSCHGKGRDAVLLSPQWRTTISVNDQREDLSVLPPLDPSLEDKINFYWVTPGPMPMPTQTEQDYRAFAATVADELPAYLHRLLAAEIPEGLKGGRFGVVAYRHPEVMRALDEISQELQLLEAVDAHFWGQGGAPDLIVPDDDPRRTGRWKGSATELESELTRPGAPGAGTVRKLTQGSAQKSGNMLSNLSRQRPERVRKFNHGGTHVYEVDAPEDWVGWMAARSHALNANGPHRGRSLQRNVGVVGPN